jgi:hypothetical protein
MVLNVPTKASVENASLWVSCSKGNRLQKTQMKTVRN